MPRLKNSCGKYNFGFTLVELLVVITILGVLSTIGLVAFSSAQIRSRDTQRKSNLKQVASALELYFSDYGAYPLSNTGRIVSCPAPAGVCTWGSSEFSDSKTLYFKTLPKDPASNYKYYYRTVTVGSVANQGFQLYAELENTQDPSCLGGNCGTHNDFPANVSCGTGVSCNFAITSSNVTAIQN